MADLHPDWDLVARVAAGDDPAFDLLMDRYQRPVVDFIHRMIGDAAEAEDVAQEVFVRAYRAMRGQALRQGTAAFSTWLFQVARNAALDSLRRRRRHPADSLEALEERGGFLADRGRTARDLAADRDTGAQIAAAVARLPEDQRSVLVLAEYGQHSYADIAAMLRCSPKSVESRLYRARQFLRRRLEHLLS